MTENHIRNVMLVRVGADSTKPGGGWHGLGDTDTLKFLYVPIVEDVPERLIPEHRSGFDLLTPFLSTFYRDRRIELPKQLHGVFMHLDPDYEHLTYGDCGPRARQIRNHINAGDLIVVYSALRDYRKSGPLLYAITGLMEVASINSYREVFEKDPRQNAHTRRQPKIAKFPNQSDVILFGKIGTSGRLKNCILIGERRVDKAKKEGKPTYRVKSELLAIWGELTTNDGYLERSCYLPLFKEPQRFLDWLEKQNYELTSNNWD